MVTMHPIACKTWHHLLAWSCIAVLCAASCKLHSLGAYEEKIYSQNGEDGILLRIIEAIGATNKQYVEFGVQDGSECNTRILRERLSFSGLMMDGGNENTGLNLRKELITVDNIIDLFQRYDVPESFDVLSVDIDSFDWWVLLRLLRDGPYRPRIVVVETNPSLGVGLKDFREHFGEANALPLTMVHPHMTNLTTWDLSRYHGANPAAFQKLGKIFGYEMVYCEMCGVNCILVHRDAIPASCGDSASFPMPTVHYPCFGTARTGGAYPGHEVDPLMRRPVLLSDSLLGLLVTRTYSLQDVYDSLYSLDEEYPLWGSDWCVRLQDTPIEALASNPSEATELHELFSNAERMFLEGQFMKASDIFENMLAYVQDSTPQCVARHWSDDACRALSSLYFNTAISILNYAPPSQSNVAYISRLLNSSLEYVSLGRRNSRIAALSNLLHGFRASTIRSQVTTWFSFVSDVSSMFREGIEMNVCSDPLTVAKEYCINNNIPADACTQIGHKLKESYAAAYASFPNAFYNSQYHKVAQNEQLKLLLGKAENAFNSEGCLYKYVRQYIAVKAEFCSGEGHRRPIIVVSGLGSDSLISVVALVLRSLLTPLNSGEMEDVVKHIAHTLLPENSFKGGGNAKEITLEIMKAANCGDPATISSYFHPAILDVDCLLQMVNGDNLTSLHPNLLSDIRMGIYSLGEPVDVSIIEDTFYPFTQKYWQAALGGGDHQDLYQVFVVPPIEMAIKSISLDFNISPRNAMHRFIELTNRAIEAHSARPHVIITFSPHDRSSIFEMMQKVAAESSLSTKNSTKFISMMTLLEETIPLSVAKPAVQIPYWFFKCYDAIRTKRVLPTSPCVE